MANPTNEHLCSLEAYDRGLQDPLQPGELETGLIYVLMMKLRSKNGGGEAAARYLARLTRIGVQDGDNGHSISLVPYDRSMQPARMYGQEMKIFGTILEEGHIAFGYDPVQVPSDYESDQGYLARNDPGGKFEEEAWRQLLEQGRLVGAH